MKYFFILILLASVVLTLSIATFFLISPDGVVQVVGIGKVITTSLLGISALVTIKTIIDIYKSI
jgi:hypothetical protein